MVDCLQKSVKEIKISLFIQNINSFSMPSDISFILKSVGREVSQVRFDLCWLLDLHGREVELTN